jgi:phospholipid transport system substrate-binding protein
VEGLGNKAIEVINTPGINDDEVTKEFTNIIEENFEIDSMAKFSLGRNNRILKEVQKTEFKRCFINMLVKLYASNFKEYKTAKFRVLSVKEKGKSKYLVESKVSIPGKKDIAIVWTVRRKEDGTFKICDASMDEVSMAQIQRAEICGAISEKGVEKFMIEFKSKYAK